MPLFRPGKPWRVLSLAANYSPGSGARDFAFDSAADDGDWTGSGLTSQVVNVSGLYAVTWSLATTDASPTGTLVAGVQKNGAFVARQSNPTGFSLQTQSGAWTHQLLDGDTIKLRLSAFSAAKT